MMIRNRERCDLIRCLEDRPRSLPASPLRLRGISVDISQNGLALFFERSHVWRVDETQIRAKQENKAMTTIRNLISLLSARNPDAQVFFMTTRKDPQENHITGIVSRDQMVDQAGRTGDGIASDDVFLVVGKRIRPGSPKAWTVAERVAPAALPSSVPQGASESRPTPSTLQTIAETHLDYDSLPEPFAAEQWNGVLAAIEEGYRVGWAAHAGSSESVSALSHADQEALARYLEQGRMDHDDDMISDVVVALGRGRQRDAAWAEIRKVSELISSAQRR